MSAPLPPFHDYLVGTLIDDPAALPLPHPPLIKRMCCALVPSPIAGEVAEPCALVLGWVVGLREQDGAISHGLCLACEDRAKREIADWQANQTAESRSFS